MTEEPFDSVQSEDGRPVAVVKWSSKSEWSDVQAFIDTLESGGFNTWVIEGNSILLVEKHD